MKKTVISGSLAILLGLSSCEQRLEVLPTQTIDQATAFTSSKDVEAALIGAYDGLQGGDANGNTYAGGYQYTSELLGAVPAELRFGGTFSNLQELYRKEITTINATAAGLWLRSYVVINRVNNVLANISKVDEAKRNKVEGEARFIRGAVYFELVRLFGKQWNDGQNTANPGVPLVLTPTTVVTESNSLPRNTVAEVYAQAIDDLTKAEGLLPVSNGFYASRNTAAAILSRLYLQQGNFAGARDAAQRVITSARYSLASSFGLAFNSKLALGGSNSPEYVFAIQVNDQDGSNGLNTFFGTTVNGVAGTAGRGDIRVLAPFIAQYQAGDVRGTFFTRAGANTFTNKFLDRFGHVPVVRLTEMILNRAEANLRLSTAIGATPLTDVNTIRGRAAASALTAVTLTDVLKERRLELAFEGFALHDIKRTQGVVIVPTANTVLPFNSPRLILPIPQREIDVNKKLIQNEGY